MRVVWQRFPEAEAGREQREAVGTEGGWNPARQGAGVMVERMGFQMTNGVFNIPASVGGAGSPRCVVAFG